ncbi:hypothetical protein OWM54_41915 [Myxococcus sp. MISCRS1]|uniref:hypothetical protein n=1 Tax=Myxococcus sp. MISCRS1 TaxID=2996786 RepID=UPI00226D52C9|nr:hypothetical protein [Myxococcus sp. MISCRS1]MCY1003721.1 hypothetical protein [Myxococcus sp. MISCRS1]
MRAAEFGREVVLDWAAYCNALPAETYGGLPSEVIARLRAEIAALRAQLGAPAATSTSAAEGGGHA